jgi:hypothetical protein
LQAGVPKDAVTAIGAEVVAFAALPAENVLVVDVYAVAVGEDALAGDQAELGAAGGAAAVGAGGQAVEVLFYAVAAGVEEVLEVAACAGAGYWVHDVAVWVVEFGWSEAAAIC